MYVVKPRSKKPNSNKIMEEENNNVGEENNYIGNQEEEEEELHAQALANLLPHMLNHEHVPIILQALHELQMDEGPENNLVTAEQLTASLLQYQSPPQVLNESPPPQPPPTTINTNLISNLDRTVYFLFASAGKEEVRVGISLRAARQSAFVHSILGDDFDSSDNDEEVEIPLLEVEHSIGVKVCEFFARHEFDPYTFATKPLPSRRGLKMSELCANAWDADFILDVTNGGMLYDVILAANYLDAPSLLDLGIVKLSMDLQNCANMEQVNKLLGLAHEGKLTVQESARVKQENAWFFQMKPLSAFVVPTAAAAAMGDEEGA